MAQYTATAVQTVIAGNNVIFTDTVVKACPAIVHREDSGLIFLRGITNQARARFRVFFSGNIAIPEDGDADPIQLSISIDGESVASSTMIVTPAATEEYFNVATSVFIDVPRGLNLTVAVKNSDTQDILVQNGSLIVERVAQGGYYGTT